MSSRSPGIARLALIQMRIEPGEAAKNLAHAISLVGEAAGTGAQFVLLPEALPFGWMNSSAREFAEEIPAGSHFSALAAAARRHAIHVCAGLVERDGQKIYNSAVLISPAGELLLRHRKIHELGIAHGCYALGDRLGVVETTFGRIGLMVCADAFAPGEVISRTLCLMGAELILSPCAWAVPPEHDNERTPYGKLWIDSYGTVAKEFGCWIAGCSNVGSIREGPWAGHKCIGCSLVVGPDGAPVVSGSYGQNAEEIILTEIRLAGRRRSSAD